MLADWLLDKTQAKIVVSPSDLYAKDRELRGVTEFEICSRTLMNFTLRVEWLISSENFALMKDSRDSGFEGSWR